MIDNLTQFIPCVAVVSELVASGLFVGQPHLYLLAFGGK